MSFELYDRSYDSYQNRYAQLVIRKDGRVGLNHQAYKVLGEPDAAQLLFDRGSKKIGVKACAPADAGAYKITKPGTYNAQDRAASFPAAGFLNHYKVAHDKAKRFPARYEDGMLVVALKEVS